MRTPDMLHGYQQGAVNFQCAHPESMMWLDMGLGKTVITLTSIAHLIRTQFLRGVLIVAPIRVCRLVWRQEAQRWSHTNGLTFSMVTGSVDQRTRALLRPANIYLVNYELLGWLAETLHTYFISKNKPLPFNGLVWDEISKMKNSTTQRVKSVRKILPHFNWTTGLTGTPASNGYKDLHGQYLVVDKGMRLGTSKTAFRQRFYRPAGPHKEVPFDDTESTIKNLIGDITLEMSAEDYNKLPDMIVNDVECELPPDLRAKYDAMERSLFLQLDSGQSKEMFNQASLTNACLQFSNGAVYPVAGMPLWEQIHDVKLDALEDLIEESAGQPILLAYAYRSDAERIMKRFTSLRPINLTECKSETSLSNAMHRWQEGDCQLMIGHPACLHPETEVLTEQRGWVRIVDVMSSERVHDGVEFVHHRGCSYSGYKDVIEVFGVTMTPDHKLLINGEWVEAKDVRDSRCRKDSALFQWEATPCVSSKVSELWGGARNDASECSKEQPRAEGALRSLHQRHVPSDDQYSDMGYLARNEVESAGSDGQELCRPWNNRLQGMAGLCQFLFGHGSNVQGRSDDRTYRRGQAVQQGQLPLGDQHGAARQQAQQQVFDVPGREITSGGSVSQKWVQQNDDHHAIEPRDDCGRSRGGLSQLELRKESTVSGCSPTQKSHVYDLVDCGPRHRFLIRNAAGEVFVSHNSMGHGVDGLQKRGHIVCWFGLTWSLDLYEQMNARIRRQGQGVPVICHRIMIKDTLDQAQALALGDKATTQEGLRKAVKDYRQTKGV